MILAQVFSSSRLPKERELREEQVIEKLRSASSVIRAFAVNR